LAVNGQLVAQSPADELLERLDDPRVAASLTHILDHADMLAMLIVGLDGFIRRGDTIAEAIADGVNDLRGAAGSGSSGADVQGLLSGVVGATPTLSALLNSRMMTDPRTASTLALLGEALVEGREEAANSPAGPTGVFGLLRALKDDDVSRGLGLLIQVAKALGRKLS
jgi:hypothetical protein